MARDVASDLCTVLERAAIGLSRTGATPNLYAAPLPEVDPLSSTPVVDQAVGVIQTLGDPPIPYMGKGAAEGFWQSRCQVVIRSPRSDFQSGQTLALQVLDALAFPVIANNFYVRIRPRESAPFYVGPDTSDRHRWVVNVESAWIDNGTISGAMP